MKISNEHVAKLLEARLQRLNRAEPSPSHQRIDPAQHGRGQPDRATFSSVLEDLRAGLAAARASAPAEHPRLASLAAQVQAGSYRVPSQHVADALLRDLRGA